MQPATEAPSERATAYHGLLDLMYLIWRGTSVVVYGPATWEARHSYRRPRLAGALWVAMSLETAWSTARVVRHGHVDRRTVWADTATSTAIAAVFPLSGPGTRNRYWEDWGVTQGSFHVEGMSFAVRGWPERAGLFALFCAGYVVGELLRPGKVSWIEAAQSGVALAFRAFLTGWLSDFVHSNVERLGRAHADTVAAAEAEALEYERARNRRYLQDRILEMLETVAAAPHPREGRIRRAAAREATGLRRLLMAEVSREGLDIASLVDTAADSGVDLEVVFGEVPDIMPVGAVDAIRDALVEACAPLAVDGVHRVVLFVDVAGDSLLATIRGAGVRRDLRLAL